ncbi:MAG: hypothetical protein CM1200mP10_12070 [Candidatus Neomarinimicrobiota bacterium]|nr:MAG: hypothetical protein CM1200mP10_12070 [Candidatus Neomarinimicrobiota bacterium]
MVPYLVLVGAIWRARPGELYAGKNSLERAPWAMVGTGLMVSIPVFFDVAFIILVPIVYALQRQTGKSLLFFGCLYWLGCPLPMGYTANTRTCRRGAHTGGGFGLYYTLWPCDRIPAAVIADRFLDHM